MRARGSACPRKKLSWNPETQAVLPGRVETINTTRTLHQKGSHVNILRRLKKALKSTSASIPSRSPVTSAVTSLGNAITVA
jgi:hypothetical protein